MSRWCKESYNDPHAVYKRLTERRMDLVTVTDHDSIDAAEALRRYPNFFLSEEVTAKTPSGTEFHMGVYGITERDHIELQARRDDFESLAAYLGERGLVYSINHVFSSLTGSRTHDDYALFSRFPLVETRNGAVPEGTNRRAEQYAERARSGQMGGSDAHSMHAVGMAWTEVAGARTADEFLQGLRAGHAIARGASGGYWLLTKAVLSIGRGMFRATPWTWVLSPLALAVPAVILVNEVRERIFARQWSSRLGLSSRVPAAARVTA